MSITGLYKNEKSNQIKNYKKPAFKYIAIENLFDEKHYDNGDNFDHNATLLAENVTLLAELLKFPLSSKDKKSCDMIYSLLVKIQDSFNIYPSHKKEMMDICNSSVNKLNPNMKFPQLIYEIFFEFSSPPIKTATLAVISVMMNFSSDFFLPIFDRPFLSALTTIFSDPNLLINDEISLINFQVIDGPDYYELYDENNTFASSENENNPHLQKFSIENRSETLRYSAQIFSDYMYFLSQSENNKLISPNFHDLYKSCISGLTNFPIISNSYRSIMFIFAQLIFFCVKSFSEEISNEIFPILINCVKDITSSAIDYGFCCLQCLTINGKDFGFFKQEDFEVIIQNVLNYESYRRYNQGVMGLFVSILESNEYPLISMAANSFTSEFFLLLSHDSRPDVLANFCNFCSDLLKSNTSYDVSIDFVDLLYRFGVFNRLSELCRDGEFSVRRQAIDALASNSDNFPPYLFLTLIRQYNLIENIISFIDTDFLIFSHIIQTFYDIFFVLFPGISKNEKNDIFKIMIDNDVFQQINNQFDIFSSEDQKVSECVNEILQFAEKEKEEMCLS